MHRRHVGSALLIEQKAFFKKRDNTLIFPSALKYGTLTPFGIWDSILLYELYSKVIRRILVLFLEYE